MTKRIEIDALKARWVAEALVAADRAFAEISPTAAYQGKPPPFPFASPFGEHEGYADFRYLPLGVSPAYRTIERADLTGATDGRNGQLGRCTLIDCRLDKASMETNLGEKIYRCSFTSAKLTHTTLYGDFVDCDFSRCDLSYSGGGQLKFIRCKFDGAKFVGARFQWCLFDQCSWDEAKIGNAAFARARFIGSWPTAEQLRDAMTPGATFDSR
jgi:uncharacterized protein YjbI with pentapeptide repeats